MEFVIAMAAWSARPWSRSSSSAWKSRGVADETASVPMTSPPGARSGAAAIPRRPSRSATVDVVGLLRDPRVGEVVDGRDRHALLGGQAVDPAAEREPHAQQPVAGLGVGAAGDDDRDEVRPVVGHPGQVGAVGAEQALGLLDDPLEDDVGLAQGGDAGGDVAQRAFGLGAPRDRLPRALQLLDEPGVGDGDGGLVGEAAEDRLVDRVEGVALVAVHLDRPERALVADDRRDDEVADAGRDRASSSVSPTWAKSAAR